MRGKGEGAIYKDARGLWTAVIELPPHPDGKRRRKTIRRKSKLQLMKDIKVWRAQFDKVGDLPTRDETVGAWLEEWYSTIAIHNVRPKTAMTYRSLLTNHIIPAVGTVKMQSLTTTHVNAMARHMIDVAGKSDNTARQAHRILGVAMNEAMGAGKVSRNVVSLTKAPRAPKDPRPALSVPDAIRVLATAKEDRLFSLWTAVLFTGQRQGELLGLEIDRVNSMQVGEKNVALLDISWQLQRISWQHGCVIFCGAKRGWDCPKKKLVAPADWENRHLTGGLWLSRPKSKSGIRVIPMVDPYRTVILNHLSATAHEPNPHGLVWRNEDGSPIDPKTILKAWYELLDRAEVPRVRFHDGRHTAVDLLYAAGVPEHLIPDIVGHSTRAQSRNYRTRVNLELLVEAVQSVADMFTPPADAHSGTRAELES